ncbi:MAG: dockerin type I domain-containing protein [Planctomycetota bacterium]
MDAGFADWPGSQAAGFVHDPDRNGAYLALGLGALARVRTDGIDLGVAEAPSEATRASGERRGAVVAFDFPGSADAVVPGAACASTLRLAAGAARAVAPAQDLRLHEVAEGVDVVVRTQSSAGDRIDLAYDVHARVAASLADFTITVRGARRLSIDDSGRLCVEVVLPDGRSTVLQQSAPTTYALRGANSVIVESRVELRGEDRFGFRVAGVDADEAVCVDPGFTWATYLGGSGNDEALATLRLPDGDLVIAGWAGSPDFPTTPGVFRQTGARDAFLSRLSPDGSTLRWSTYLGGREAEEIEAIALAPDGDLVVGGWTGSIDFPVSTNAYQRLWAGGGLLTQVGDGFVAKLSPDGRQLRWSTFLGRFGDDFVRGLAVDGDGSVIVAGDTTAADFPTTPGSYQTVFGSGNLFLPDAFVSRLSSDGTRLLASTYLGGFAQEFVGGLALAADGSIWIGGLSASSGLPVSTGAFQRDLRGFWDGFVARLSPELDAVIACTYLGGDGYEQILDLALDADGELVCVGRVGGDPAGFPTTPGAYQRTTLGGDDAFVARMSADVTELHAATLLGGALDDAAEGVSFTSDGGVVVVGFTGGQGFPVGGQAAQPNFGGGIQDGFVAHLDATLGMPFAVSYAGGAERDSLRGLVAIGVGEEFLAIGSTASSDLPVSGNALQSANAGGSDAMFVRIDAQRVNEEFLAIAYPASTLTPSTFAPGDRPVAFRFFPRNRAGTAVDVLAVELIIAGTGDAATDLLGVSLWHDVDDDGRVGAGDREISPRTAVSGLAGRVTLATNLRIQPAETLALIVLLESSATCTDGVEFGVTLEGDFAITARRVDDGRRVGVLSGDAQGSPFVCGREREFRADVDGDGLIDVRDVRRLVRQQGATGVDPTLDPDRDGAITASDVAMLISRVLDRSSLAPLPTELAAGGFLVLSGFELESFDLRCELGGRELPPRNQASRRSAVFAVPRTTPRAELTLEVFEGSESIARRTVTVR